MAAGDSTIKSRRVFASVTEVILRDGVLTREEQRLATKLAILLFRDDDELRDAPPEIYAAISAGEEIKGGRTIGRQERLTIYREMFETAFVNASLSHDEMAAIAVLRSVLEINDNEHDESIMQVKRSLEESVEPKLLEKVRDEFNSVIDIVGGMFDTIRLKTT